MFLISPHSQSVLAPQKVRWVYFEVQQQLKEGNTEEIDQVNSINMTVMYVFYDVSNNTFSQYHSFGDEVDLSQAQISMNEMPEKSLNFLSSHADSTIDTFAHGSQSRFIELYRYLSVFSDKNLGEFKSEDLPDSIGFEINGVAYKIGQPITPVSTDMLQSAVFFFQVRSEYLARFVVATHYNRTIESLRNTLDAAEIYERSLSHKGKVHNAILHMMNQSELNGFFPTKEDFLYFIRKRSATDEERYLLSDEDIFLLFGLLTKLSPEDLSAAISDSKRDISETVKECIYTSCDAKFFPFVLSETKKALMTLQVSYQKNTFFNYYRSNNIANKNTFIKYLIGLIDGKLTKDIQPLEIAARGKDQSAKSGEILNYEAICTAARDSSRLSVLVARPAIQQLLNSEGVLQYFSQDRPRSTSMYKCNAPV